jgi:23S rRNA (uracil1939-C5)-methyltransferase
MQSMQGLTEENFDFQEGYFHLNNSTGHEFSLQQPCSGSRKAHKENNTSMNPQTDSFTVHIDSIAYGGRGVGRRGDGKVVFVSTSIPGENVYVSVTKEHKNYLLAEVEDILDASPYRIQAPCRFFPACGGCDWQHIAYSQQVSFKKDIFLSQVQAKCPLEAPIIEDDVVSPMEYGYRCHAIIRCTHETDFTMGFYQKQSNTIVPHEQCLILNEHIQTAQSSIKTLLNKSPVNRLVSLEMHSLSDRVLVQAVCKGKSRRRDLDTFRMVFEQSGIHGLSYFPLDAPNHEQVFGNVSLNYEINVQDTRLLFSTGFGSFIQVNPLVNEALVNHVVNLAKGSKRILDLYCGNGNFSIPLALKAGEVIAVEKDSSLTNLGKDNARINGLKNVRFSTLDAENAVVCLSSEKDRFDTVVLDPPREGAKVVVSALIRMKPGRIIYISCDPSTLTRDLAILTQNGYKLKNIRLFDMFPQTYHMESVSYLERVF